MHLSEPVTALTDVALAAIGLVCAVSLGRRIDRRTRVSGVFWCVAFAAAAVSALAGAAYHGVDALDAGARRALWNLVMFAGGAALAMIASAIHAAHVRRVDGTVKWLAWGIAVSLAGLVVQRSSFPRGAAFNHNDAFHVIQMAGLWCFYRCARTTHDRHGLAVDASCPSGSPDSTARSALRPDPASR